MKELPARAVQVDATCSANAHSLIRLADMRGERLELLVTALNVHARNLVAFFDARRPNSRPDDIHATDYTASWDPGRHGGIDLVYLKTAFLPGVHKRLAHLTARRVRVDADEDAVPLAEICMAIAGMMERFLQLLPDDRRSWFDRDGRPPDTSPSALLPLDVVGQAPSS